MTVCDICGDGPVRQLVEVSIDRRAAGEQPKNEFGRAYDCCQPCRERLTSNLRAACIAVFNTMKKERSVPAKEAS